MNFSDHHPLLISLKEFHQYGRPRSFKFESAWIFEDSFEAMLTSTWHQSNSFLTSLERVKIASSSWNIRTFKSLIQKKNKLLGRILGIQRVCQEGKGDFGLEKRENKLKQKLSLFLHQEEIMWFRRSKIKWLFDGDRNTKFYHTVAIQRRRRKSVSIIQSNYGVWIYDPIKFQQIFKD